jgi:predicted cupin superfamily sugar epimerase
VSRLSPAEIRSLLELEPHPTCGFVHETFRSPAEIPASALPGFDGARGRGSVLYFLVTPEAQMALHRIKPEQMYHHYLGDPIEVLMLAPDGPGRVEVVGSLADGHRPQLLIPGDTWHVSRLLRGGEYALLATTEWPAVEPPDVSVGDPGELAKTYPDMAEEIHAFAPPGRSAPLRT